MICKRCGQCCIHLDILVVNPRSILPDGSLDRSDPEAMISKPAGQICPHLVFEAKEEGDIATCTIHSLPCYKAVSYTHLVHGRLHGASPLQMTSAPFSSALTRMDPKPLAAAFSGPQLPY